MAIQNILDRQGSDPLKIFQAVALGEAVGGVLEQVPDPEWRSRLRRAARSVGVEEAVTSSLTVTSTPDGSVALSATDENGQRDGTIGLAAMEPALDPRATVPLDPAGKPVKLPATSRDSEDASGQPDDLSGTVRWAGGDGAGTRFSSLAAVGPWTILSRPETLNASGSRRACRMGAWKVPPTFWHQGNVGGFFRPMADAPVAMNRDPDPLVQ